MNDKQKALVQVTLIYLVVGLAGWATMKYFEGTQIVLRFIYADLVMTLVAFIFSVLKKNSSVYDPYWSLIPFYFVLFWYGFYDGAQWSSYEWICALAITFWGFRLTLSWGRGWPGWHHEDWRYVNFRNQFGKLFELVNFSGIHLFPTVIVFLGMWPLFWVFDFGELQNPALFYIGAILAVLGTFLELFADNELDRFRKRENKKKEDILRTGIWAYSRNPNYLGEMLFWFGLLGMGLAYGAPYYTAVGSVGMVTMFLMASIPMKDKQMEKNRPEAFAKYKREVSRILPLPPKNK